MFIFKSSKLGPTINGKKLLLKADNKTRENILRNVKKDWKELLRLHFISESGIAKSGLYGKWKPLSRQYTTFKERNDLHPGILEASTPLLMTRYQQSIKYNVKEFSISINYPDLISGSIYPSTGEKRLSSYVVNAGVLQKGSEKTHLPKRRIILSQFALSYKNRLIEGLTKGLTE